MRAGLCTSRLEPVLTRLCTWQKKLKAAAEEEQAKKRRLLKELNEDIKNRSRSLLGLASAGEGTQAAQGSKDEVVSGRVTYLLPARAPAKAESGQVQVETEFSRHIAKGASVLDLLDALHGIFADAKCHPCETMMIFGLEMKDDGVYVEWGR